ncbi:hypothetical protein TIFTF001_003785 [Ficus carica]|uniref:Exostosin GT47 domain-containing protein n=1 Tax=Ficus carica TaxID=3494 RepID=A0AA88A1L3_FICCA|nr:hypothetical protein TIFTF001_003785 [Ficus carica]
MDCKNCIFFVAVFILLVLIQSRSILCQKISDKDECSNRRIHIRRLPPRFNLDLLANCSEYPLSGDFCPFLTNHGLGQKTHNRSHSWYRTDPLMLELLFHRRMLEYPCLTPDPSSADAIFLPYYAGIDALRYLYGPDVNSSADHGLDLFDFLQRDNRDAWARRAGHDHFLVMARPAWDFSQSPAADPPVWGTSFLEIPEFFNVTALTLESRAWPWQEQAVPYPTSFHPPNLALFDAWVNRVRRTRRSTLMLFVGGGGTVSPSSAGTPNIRRSIRAECDNLTASSATAGGGGGYGYGSYGASYTEVCRVVDCSNGVCEHDPIRFMRAMLESSFCLQPPGDTPTRRSTFDGILAGCIPVFFEEQSARSQYGWHLPEAEFEELSVTIPKEEVVMKGLRIVEVLRGIPRARVRKMREKVVEMIGRVMYRRHGSSMGLRGKKDAFDVAVESALNRISQRLRQLPLLH